MKKTNEYYELRGAMKMLYQLWDNSYYSMGKDAAARIEKELKYYLGENWTSGIHELIDEPNEAYLIEPLKKIKELP